MTRVGGAGLAITTVNSAKGSWFEKQYGPGFGLDLKNCSDSSLRVMFLQETVRDEWAAVLVRVE